MKRALIGGFFALIGSIWSLMVVFVAGNNLVSGWSTPPGRFLTTISELNLTSIFVLSILFVVLGLVILAVELFRKDK